jgi:hypothetical protein
MAISSKYSGGTGSAPQGVQINDNRRIFNFGERVAELNPVQSPFFTYLSKVSRKPTDDPVFKFLEQRHQWQRRNFEVNAAVTEFSPSSGAATVSNMRIMAKYDEYGRTTTLGQPCGFILEEGDSVGQVIMVQGTFDVDGSGSTAAVSGPIGIRITTNDGNTAVSGSTAGYTQIDGTIISILGKPINATDHPDASKISFAAGAKGQVIGSAHAEGGKAPDGWEDALFDREGYCQIFKTGMKLFFWYINGY